MTTEYWIGALGVAATLLGVIVTWRVARYSQTRRELTYKVTMEPILRSPIPALEATDLRISYKGEELPEPVLLSVDVTNTGNAVIENPPIEIRAPGATYVIPGYFESPPPGYETIWMFERNDGESCAIRLPHINPGQTAKARMLMDEMPGQLPQFICPMAGVFVRRQMSIKVNKFVQFIVDIISPQLGGAIRSLTE
ncbi:MAG TPA: hypothetical protein VJZ71_12095 [Phycisphaerae bacterium]|nr:hypothetical protein [Phycisphaerae bacterium]